jgi:hypothetical protein
MTNRQTGKPAKKMDDLTTCRLASLFFCRFAGLFLSPFPSLPTKGASS